MLFIRWSKCVFVGRRKEAGGCWKYKCKKINEKISWRWSQSGRPQRCDSLSSVAKQVISARHIHPRHPMILWPGDGSVQVDGGLYRGKKKILLTPLENLYLTWFYSFGCWRGRVDERVLLLFLLPSIGFRRFLGYILRLRGWRETRREQAQVTNFGLRQDRKLAVRLKEWMFPKTKKNSSSGSSRYF